MASSTVGRSPFCWKRTPVRPSLSKGNYYRRMHKNERIYLDKTLVPDPFKWALDQFKGGKLPAMLTHAG
jgi:hypothetical protein